MIACARIIRASACALNSVTASGSVQRDGAERDARAAEQRHHVLRVRGGEGYRLPRGPRRRTGARGFTQGWACREVSCSRHWRGACDPSRLTHARRMRVRGTRTRKAVVGDGRTRARAAQRHPRAVSAAASGARRRLPGHRHTPPSRPATILSTSWSRGEGQHTPDTLPTARGRVTPPAWEYPPRARLREHRLRSHGGSGWRAAGEGAAMQANRDLVAMSSSIMRLADACDLTRRRFLQGRRWSMRRKQQQQLQWQ